MNDIVKIMNGDQLFEINNMDVNVPTITCQFGNTQNDYLEITTSKLGGFIISINCQRQNNMIEMNMNFPEPEDIYKAYNVAYYPKSYNNHDIQDCGPFQLVFNEKELDILFSSNVDAVRCYKNDRVEYYLDESNNLLYIRIRNLTLDEYNVLKSQKKKVSVEDEIQNNLKKIENDEGVQILGASLIGSHAWGYSTEESDIDLRFVYVRDLKEYLSLEKKNDSLAYEITDKWDVLGWDLNKFLQMLVSQNSTIYEFLFSPIQFNQNEYFEKLKEYAKVIFNKDKMIKQYLSLIESRIFELSNDYKKQKPIKTKFVLYILRLICMINYINEKNDFPTCDYETLLNADSNKYLVNMVTKLISDKKNGINFIQIDESIIEYLKGQFSNLKMLEKMEIKHDIDKLELDNLFIEGINCFGKSWDYNELNNNINNKR